MRDSSRISKESTIGFAFHYPKFFTIAVVGIILCLSISANAVDVGGLISENTTWAVADSPFNLTQSLMVKEGSTLTIEAGSVINISPECGFLINGEIIARGTEGKPIIFQPVTGTEPGSWRAINFGDTSTDAVFDDKEKYISGSILEFCTIKNGGGSGAEGQIVISQSTPLIQSCKILDGTTGIHTTYEDRWGVTEHLRLLNNTVSRNNGYGIWTRTYYSAITIEDYRSYQKSRVVSHYK